MAAGAESRCKGATEQAASTEQASSSVEQMAGNIKQNADNAAQTEKIARQSAKDAESQRQRGEQGRGRDADHRGQDRHCPGNRQTDLLALNAAVEAATRGRATGDRSGQRGAQSWPSAARGRRNQHLSTDTVKAATEAGEMLTRLVPDIRRTAELVSEISASCREQDIGAAQMNTAVEQLDKVTQQNAGSAEEISATAEELASQAEVQASIAFSSPTRSAPPHAAPYPHGASMSTAARRRAGRSGITRRFRRDQQARVKGFALDLEQGGPDGDDLDFEAVA
jgi:methyl-accepting chemotaxis protein